MKRTTLRLTQSQHVELKAHLYPGDGFEAVAVGLCGRRRHEDVEVLCLHKLVPIPYLECKERTPDRVTWSTERLRPLLEEAEQRDMAILKIHCHPGGLGCFSETDDASDLDLFNSVFGWTGTDHPHCSAVMLPDGRMFGRTAHYDDSLRPLDSILIAGDDIQLWTGGECGSLPGFVKRHQQLFGAGTTARLRALSVAVIGCSGTGSPLIEQLARLGVGRFVLVDPDHVEEKNLNRIMNSGSEDAYLGRPKVEVMAKAIARMGFGTQVRIVTGTLIDPNTVKIVASCDVAFGCMDSVEGRHLLNRLTAYYSMAYFDLGVKLVADGSGGIDEALGAVHYLRPDGSTLYDRNVYTMAQVKAEGLKRTDSEAYREQVMARYIQGVQEDRPAVISINTQIASLAVNELLARLHPYRLDPNEESAIVRVAFMHGADYREREGDSSGIFSKYLGRGDVTPMLGMPELSS